MARRRLPLSRRAGEGPARAARDRDWQRLRLENALFRRAAGASPDARALAATLLRLVATLLPGCPCEVLVGDPHAGFLEVVGTRGFRPERGLGCRLPLGVGVTGAAARQARPLWVPDVSADTRYIPGVPGARWELALPLETGGHAVGVVDLESAQSARPTASQRRYLTALIAAVAPGFARALPGAHLAPVHLDVLRSRHAGARQSPLADAARLSTVYEPVAEVASRRIIGYEALVSGAPGGPWERPARLFAAGQEPAEAAALDLARLRAALDRWRPGAGQLFLDVHASSLRQHSFVAGVAALLREFEVAPAGLVLDLADAGGHLEAVARTVGALGAAAPPLAVDRFGAGGDSPQALLELKPAFVKLDPALVRGLDHDFGRRTYIESLCYYTRRVHTQAVALGVATSAELAALHRCGVRYAQGDFLGPAAPLPARRVDGPHAVR